MDRLIVRGGQPLIGSVAASGSKNSSLGIIVGAALVEGECILENVPHDTDVFVMCEILKELGAYAEFHSDGCLHVDGTGLSICRAPYDLVRRMRASFYVTGLLLARLGKAEVPLPGGCSLGPRPVDIHIKGFQALGAETSIEFGCLVAKVKTLQGAKFLISRSSVGATINMMLAACLSDGTTVLENAAKEPEVVDLAVFLNSAGARIRGAGTDQIRIDGVDRLHKSSHAVIPDRIEAGTYLIAGAITGGDITVTDILPNHLRALSSRLVECGAEVEEGESHVRCRCEGAVTAVDIDTSPYPGFPTDLQPPFLAMLALAHGTSVVHETIFIDRFRFTDELRRMGADVRIERDTAIVRGVERLTGAPVEATDLRAGAALVVAGLAAEGTTEIANVEFLDRGYEMMEKKLGSLGASILREPHG